MKVLKRILCVFLAVVLLFFSVNNSYFSPHKMDKVEAASIVVGGTALTVEFIVQVIAALAVAGISVGVIVEWSDMDLEATLEDFHSWLQSNTAVLDSLNIDGTSALKEWAASDTWTVIEGGAGGSEPSPSPDNNENAEESTHGGGKIWPAGTTWTIGNLIVAGGVLAGQVYNKIVSMDPAVNAVAQAYMQEKINTFDKINAGMDAITQALLSRFQPALIELPEGYAAWSELEIVKWNCENLGYMSDSLNFVFTSSQGTYTIDVKFSKPIYIVPYIDSAYGCYNFRAVFFEDTDYVEKLYLNGELYMTNTTAVNIGDSGYKTLLEQATSGSLVSSSCPIPFVVNANYNLHVRTIGLGCPQNDLRHPYNKNYIDTSDDYGWASTANISPNDLAAAMPDIAGNLNGRYVSLAGVVAAINALKNQLEEKNPNVGTDTPVPYPNVDDYVETVKDVITDPEVFPQTDAAVDPELDIGSAPDSETMKDYSGLLGLIIGILQNILQAIKDLLSWFVIDFPAIKAHILEALEDIPGLKGYEDFLAIVDYAKTQITDSYEYPVITIECPEILKPYWKQDVIVLLDFEDYAKYFLWVRMAMSFALLFGFVLWLFKDIKVQFSVS